MLNLGQRKEFTEPIFRALRTGILHRFVQNDGLHLITIPKSPIASTSRCALIVVIESQGLVVTFQHGIDLILCGEVTRVALFIRMGVSDLGMVLIKRCSVAADQRGTIVEHIFRVLQGRTLAPIAIANDGLQRRTAVEHTIHDLHLVNIERIEVKLGQRRTILEHILHIRHLAGVERTEVKFSKRWTVEHMAHIRHLLRIERTQVKRGKVIASLEHSLHIRHFVRIKMTEVKRGKCRTAAEHKTHICHLLRIERTQVKRGKVIASLEHSLHIRHFVRIKMTEVKRGKCRTAAEHKTHICHLLRIERTEVNRGKYPTALEHRLHIGHIVSNEILHTLYLFHIPQIHEHSVHRSEPCFFHRSVNDCLCYLVVIVLETYCIRVVYRVIDFGAFSSSLVCFALVVVVIREHTGRLIECGIYLRPGDHCLCGEVTRVALFIRMGVSDAGMTRIILRSVAADQRPAAFEHIRRRGQYRALVPGITAVDRSQPHAHEEHVTHVGHLAGVERIEIQFGK